MYVDCWSSVGESRKTPKSRSMIGWFRSQLSTSGHQSADHAHHDHVTLDHAHDDKQDHSTPDHAHSGEHSKVTSNGGLDNMAADLAEHGRPDHVTTDHAHKDHVTSEHVTKSVSHKTARIGANESKVGPSGSNSKLSNLQEY